MAGACGELRLVLLGSFRVSFNLAKCAACSFSLRWNTYGSSVGRSRDRFYMCACRHASVRSFDWTFPSERCTICLRRDRLHYYGLLSHALLALLDSCGW